MGQPGKISDLQNSMPSFPFTFYIVEDPLRGESTEYLFFLQKILKQIKIIPPGVFSRSVNVQILIYYPMSMINDFNIIRNIPDE